MLTIITLPIPAVILAIIGIIIRTTHSQTAGILFVVSGLYFLIGLGIFAIMMLLFK